MIAQGFKPVGWVAAVATAALGCYMLSLNVASERAELSNLERQIVLAKRDIRSLQTELGTRGRLQQLEHWNADVLALSAPASGQFLRDEFTLASYSEPEKSFEERAKVRMASAEVPAQPSARPAVERDLVTQPSSLDKPIVRRASLVMGQRSPFTAVGAAPEKEPKVVKTVPKAPMIKVAAKPEAKPAASKSAASKAAPSKVPAQKTTVEKSATAKSKPKSAGLISSDLEREIAHAAKAENKSGGASGR